MLFIFFMYVFLFIILFYSLKSCKELKPILSEVFTARSLITISVGILMINLFIINYMKNENTLYFWDYVAYWDMSITNMHIIDNSSPSVVFSNLINSINSDSYNIFPTYLIYPFLKLFGITRISFILGILNLFLIPSVFLLALISKQSIQEISKFSKLRIDIIFVILLLFPPLITPMLRGYLDIVGLIPACLILLKLMNHDFKKIDILSSILLSFLIVLVLFTRRWYAFFIVSLCVSYLMIYTAKVIKNRSLTTHSAIKILLNWLIIAVCLLIILAIFFRPFLRMSGGVDYSYIYSAYRFGSLSNEIMSMVYYVGILTCIFICIGVFKGGANWFSLIMLLQAPLQFFLFWRIESFGQQHYYIFMPCIAYFMILGINTIIQSYKKLNCPLLIIILSLILLQFYNSFVRPIFISIDRNILSQSIRYSNTRLDVYHIRELADYLNSLHSNSYILASSNVTINDDILRHVNMPGKNNAVPNLLFTHSVDLSDGFPYEFMNTKYVVVADPVQLHLGEKNQRVVWFFANNILAQSSFGQNYKLLKVFSIDNNIKINVYEKEKCFTGEQLEYITNSFRNYYPNDERFNNLQLGKFGCQDEK